MSSNIDENVIRPPRSKFSLVPSQLNVLLYFILFTKSFGTGVPKLGSACLSLTHAIDH